MSECKYEDILIGTNQKPEIPYYLNEPRFDHEDDTSSSKNSYQYETGVIAEELIPTTTTFDYNEITGAYNPLVKFTNKMQKNFKPLVESQCSLKSIFEIQRSLEPLTGMSAAMGPIWSIQSAMEPLISVASMIEPVVSAVSAIEPIMYIASVMEPMASVISSLEPLLSVASLANHTLELGHINVLESNLKERTTIKLNPMIKDHSVYQDFYNRQKWLKSQRKLFQNELLVYIKHDENFILLAHSKTESDLFKQIDTLIENNTISQEDIILFDS